LANVAPSPEPPFFHTEMECRAQRQNGEVFLAHIWFSTYQTMSGPRLAAIVFDTSEELRDRAEFNLQQILTGSKVLVSALCHEIRNAQERVHRFSLHRAPIRLISPRYNQTNTPIQESKLISAPVRNHVEW